MRADGSGGWLTGWSPEEPLELARQIVRAEPGAWEDWPGTGLAGRDLGLAAASGGRLSAQRVRATGRDVHGGGWHCYDLDFEFLYVVGGALTLESEEGAVHELVAGSTFCHPAFYLHRDVFRSGDLEVVRLTSPADGTRFDEGGSEPPARAAGLRGTRSGVYTHAAGAAYAAGEPGDGLLLRDLGTATPTAGRIGMRLARRAPRRGAAGRQDATLAQWSVILGGERRLLLDGRPAERLGPGDAFSPGAAPGERHDAGSISDDYVALELCTPARGFSRSSPPGRAAARRRS